MTVLIHFLDENNKWHTALQGHPFYGATTIQGFEESMADAVMRVGYVTDVEEGEVTFYPISRIKQFYFTAHE